MNDDKASAKALEVDRILFEYYGGPFRFFSTKDALSELVSSMLSHRTKNAVTRVAYHQLRERLPDWRAVMEAPTEVVQSAISPVTYAEVKAPRIQQALAYVLEHHGRLELDWLGELPVADARAWLENIPGVGAKTSAATLNFSHLRMPALVVDTHHHRVALRIGLVPPKSTLDKAARRLAEQLPKEWDGQRVYDNHQALMRHGQRMCYWKAPACTRCPVQALCDYARSSQ